MNRIIPKGQNCKSRFNIYTYYATQYIEDSTVITKMENDNVLSLAFFNLSNVVNVFFAIYIPIIKAAIEESSNKTSCERELNMRIR